MTEGLRVTVTTTDANFVSDLRKADIAGIEASRRPIPSFDSAETLYQVVIEAATADGLALVSSWLYERIKFGRFSKMTLNSNNVIRNPDRIMMIINNQIQVHQSAGAR
jgi:hypothetical protein